MRLRFGSGAPWEASVGYSRAVRVGDRVFVSGTTATDTSGTTLHPGDAYLQALAALENIKTALERAGARLQDVTRTRTYIVRKDDWADVGRAHGEVFGEVRPATSMVRVAGLIVPELLVEIEADAVIESP